MIVDKDAAISLAPTISCLLDNANITIKIRAAFMLSPHTAETEVFCAAVKVGKSVALDIFFGVNRRSCSDAAEDGDALLGEESQPERHCQRFVCLFT